MLNWFLENAAGDVASKGNITFTESLVITAVCVLIVFLMLIILALFVSAFKLLKGKEKPVVEKVAQPVEYSQPSSLKLEDIKDEDMMVAALVATIDYHEETKQDVRVVSIKQIG